MLWWNFLLLLLTATTVMAQEPLRLFYYERPPYMVTHDNGTIVGISASRVQQALTKAGIAFQWEKVPAKRQLQLIEHNEKNACGVGWYKTTKRQSFAQFSLPVFTDKAPVIITRQSFNPSPESSLKVLISNPKTRILMKEGLTYGQYISSQTLHAQAILTTVTMEQPQMLEMIAAGRADFMFATREEAEYAFNLTPQKKRLKIITLNDIPAGENRYLMCSKTLSAEQMNLINLGIKTLPALP